MFDYEIVISSLTKICKAEDNLRLIYNSHRSKGLCEFFSFSSDSFVVVLASELLFL